MCSLLPTPPKSLCFQNVVIDLGPHWVSTAVSGSSLAKESSSYSLVVLGLLIAVGPLVSEQRPWARRLQQLWPRGLVPPWRVGSSQTRDRTCVSCMGRQALDPWTTREVMFFKNYYYLNHYSGFLTALKSLSFPFLKHTNPSISVSFLKNKLNQKKTKVRSSHRLSHKVRLLTGEDSTHGHHQMVNTEIRWIIFFAARDRKALYSQQKQDWELTVVQIMKSLLPTSDLN